VNQTIARVAVPAELDPARIVELHESIRGILGDAAGRTLVLEGADGVFCRGMSLAGHDDAGDPAEAARTFAACLAALRFAGKPTIAAVDGEALGGGLGIAAACDVVLATPRSSFGLPELLFGLLPAIVLPVVAERTSPQRARLLALRARSVPADRALELGLADEVVPEEELARAISRHARALSRSDPGAVAGLKRYTAEIAGLDVAGALDRGAEVTATALANPATSDAIHGFLAEGTAPWLA
jgi:enoyl-CoA hydratase/carnithine racemase